VNRCPNRWWGATPQCSCQIRESTIPPSPAWDFNGALLKMLVDVEMRWMNQK